MSKPGPYIFDVEDARKRARQRMPHMLYNFVDGAAGTESANRQNMEVLEGVRLQPRVLEDVSQRSLTTTFLGEEMGLPFGIAPMGMCNLTWPGTDRFFAEEAKARKIPHCGSTAASTSLEDMLQMSDGRAWFQLYVGNSPDASLGFIDRAAAAGYKTIQFTVDVPELSRRTRELRSGFTYPFSMGPKEFMDFALHPRWSISSLLAGVPRPLNYEAIGFQRDQSRAGADWDFLKRLRDRWKGNLVVKGVMHPGDAQRIQKMGADAIQVSNHGGRQMDGAPAAIEVLPLIRKAVGPDFPLIFDSGLRTGEDVVKALAMGANFTMFGRAFLYASGADGHRGVSTLMDIFAREISVTLAQIGVRDIADVNEDVLYQPEEMTSA